MILFIVQNKSREREIDAAFIDQVKSRVELSVKTYFSNENVFDALVNTIMQGQQSYDDNLGKLLFRF